MRLLIILLLGFLIFEKYSASEYVRLPGNNVLPNIRLKSGYLDADEQSTWKMFYLLLEARDVPRHNAPLIIWFNGGPGCSSLGAFFQEFGPLYVNYDGKTLFENPHSWYHKSNILFLESPIGTGFSFDVNIANYSKADDETTSKQNFQAVSDFFKKKHPEYKNNNFFIAAESYGGVYGPMLSALVVESIAQKSFPNTNFKGLMIGNGYMNTKLTTNTMVLWSAYHARTSPDEWDEIKIHCQTPGARDVDEYDFTKFMKAKNRMDYLVDNSTKCGRLLEPLVGDNLAQYEGYSFYNFYNDCYINFTLPNAIDPVQKSLRNVNRKGIEGFMNDYSTDNKLAYSCWDDDALEKYLNSPIVKRALKVDPILEKRSHKWEPCNNPMYDEYTMTFDDTTPFFSRIFNNLTGPAFKIMFYNGDVDTACNYLADQYFSRSLAKLHKFKKTKRHHPWFYSKAKVLAGYAMRYEGTNKIGRKLSLDVVSVKGAGHFVPFDRPGPAYQMFNNFILTEDSKPVNYTVFRE